MVTVDADSVGGAGVLDLPGVTLASPAFFEVGSSASPAVQPQFVVGPAVVYAFGWWAGGAGVALLLPALAMGLALLALGLLVARVAGAWVGVATAAVTGILFPVVHTARATYSEPLAMLTLTAGLLAMTLAVVAGRDGAGAGGGEPVAGARGLRGRRVVAGDGGRPGAAALAGAARRLGAGRAAGGGARRRHRAGAGRRPARGRPIGRTPRSNPATYTGLFTPIRELFAQVKEARERGYGPGRFSFNVKGGRCEACQGDGLIKVEMHFLPDVYVSCDVCHGQRYNRETLDVRYKDKNIHEVLAMTVEQAYAFFEPVPAVARKLATLLDVGLGYITLGQSATTLSGGEAQRVKLALELSKRDTGRTLYILDEPTTGLHFHDIELLLTVLHRLRDHGNTVVVIEHNLDVIKTADWIIDLGPEGGAGGGMIVAEGAPEEVAAMPGSYTARYLKPVLAQEEKRRGKAARESVPRNPRGKRASGDLLG